MTTKREPLLSARLFDVLRSLDGNVAEWVTDDLLSIHDDLVKQEAARAKDAALIQTAVDMAHDRAYEWTVKAFRDMLCDKELAFLAAAAAAGFTPSEP